MSVVPVPGTSPAGGNGKQSQAERVRDRMWQQILRAELLPGQMVSESDLAREYGVSKTPVREALQMLVVSGLVTVLPRKGYIIRTLSFHDIREVMDLRLILEPRLAALAAGSTSPELVNTLRDELHQQFRAEATLDERVTAAHQFHHYCARASRNTRAASVVAMLSYEIQRLHHLFPVVETHVSSEGERTAHEAILAAIAAGDGEAAETHMRDHLLESNTAMLRAFYESGGSPVN